MTIKDILSGKKIEEGYDFLEGQLVNIHREGNTLIIDGSARVEYTETPHLYDPNEIYYIGCGVTWGEDLDGNRYHKIDPPGNPFNIFNKLRALRRS